ncbi:hypothetical protein GPECTOR_10g928 [Gonium pectorale]|uniref:Uncharacterized protein n=1 Tax=Gonium pectorale TaxID=33097 RepID=A0A150GQZ6_GONPE|nr:hypothetical protein GPECTOR_10g928 [Gonium pectorale]|eukprot:KXZ52296.1 hypothetical protein GPECTOR_10g928 [Gonium pectorale]
MATEEEAPAAEGNARRPYSPEEALQQLSAIPEEKRTFAATKLITALTAQRDMIQAFKGLEKAGDQVSLSDIAHVILLFLRNIYNLVCALPGTLMFDALEDLMGRSGLLAPFLAGMKQVDGTMVLQLGLPSNDSLCDSHEELIRIAATAIVCYYHYTNFPGGGPGRGQGFAGGGTSEL